MHKIETILGGIALILFGIASILLLDYLGGVFFEFTAVICPFLGLGFTIFGLIYDGKKDDKTEE